MAVSESGRLSGFAASNVHVFIGTVHMGARFAIIRRGLDIQAVEGLQGVCAVSSD